MHQEIVCVEVQPRPLAAVRVTTVLSEWPSQFMKQLNEVYRVVHAGQVRQRGQNVMVYRPRTDGRVDIECGIEVEAKFESAEEVVYCETPGGAALTTAHIGPYDQLRASHRAVVEWSRAHGHTLSGICWEIYGDWEEDPARLRTDIFHLIGR